MGTLADYAGRAKGSVLSKLKVCKDLDYAMYSQLHESCVCQILSYGAGVWGLKDDTKAKSVQNRAICSS